MRKYGIPYQGSKNKLAERICDLFPTARNFYDLFCGGCAVTHCALSRGQFERYVINDICAIPVKLFTGAIEGKYRNEDRWISHDDFMRLRGTDEYVACCFSFGNDYRSYCYSPEIEPWKKALHYARVFGDFSLLESFGIHTDGSRLDIGKNLNSYKKKYIEWYLKNVLLSEMEYDNLKKHLETECKNEKEKLQNYLLDGLHKSGLTISEVQRRLGTQMGGHYFGKSQWAFPTKEMYDKMREFMPYELDYEEIYGIQKLKESLERLQSLESLERLQSLESLERLQSLEYLERLQSLERLQILEYCIGDYADITIEPESVIYCDIPYEGTANYFNQKFDYARFYSWCERQTEPVFISSYAMPADRFIEVAQFAHRSIISATKNNAVTEKVFVPKHQSEMFRQSDLFGGFNG